ncbi:MAG: hypothetical protein NXI22_19550 [bacterium]|nr:hypothetical protein [bacterium]
MRKLFIILLMSSLIANQGLYLTHAHEGMSGVEAHEHAARPHFHLHSHGHGHGEKHHASAESIDLNGTAASLVSFAHDHDADVVFCLDSEVFVRKSDRQLASLLTAFPCEVLSGVSACIGSVSRDLWMTATAESLLTHASPLYLRTLSLRL